MASIEFWFDFGSNYSYLAAMRIEALAAKAGVDVHWRPFVLGQIFRDQGWATSPFVLQKAKGAYVWKDMARQCAKYGLPWTQPSEFPRSAILPHRLALLASQQPWGPEFCRKVFQRNFVQDQALDSEEAVVEVLVDMNLNPADWLGPALSPTNKQALRDQTAHAVSLGIFGAPTFLVNGELYWGNDRLEDALAHVASLPFRTVG